MPREAKINNNLTRKQLGFVSRYLKGDSATQAALVTYNTSDPKVASSIASENLRKPAIQAAISKALRLGGLSLDVLATELAELATSKPEKISGDTKLKAIIEVLKLQGAYPDKKNSGVSIQVTSQVNSMTFGEARERMIELHTSMQEFMADCENE